MSAVEVEALIERVLGPLGRRVDRASPFADGRLADGSRVHVVVPPVAIDGPHLTIRRFRPVDAALEDFADATVVAVLPDVTVETALSLGNLRRQGFAVSVVLIMIRSEQLEKCYGRLLAEGIIDVRPLGGEEGLPELCQQQVRKATPYLLQTEL